MWLTLLARSGWAPIACSGWAPQGILLELPLAGFFLKKLLRRGCDVNDLPSLDAELYRCRQPLRCLSTTAVPSSGRCTAAGFLSKSYLEIYTA